MFRIPQEEMKKVQGKLAAMEGEFNHWRPHLQELAKYLLPRRYVWLAERSPLGAANSTSNSAARASRGRNASILDPTGTKALQDMAAGLLSGITSPARPWLRLRPSSVNYEKQTLEQKAYTDEVTRRMLVVLAESNFYSAMAVQFLDLGAFGSSAVICYEDYDDVVRFYNSPVGEFRFSQDYRRMVDTFSRTIVMTVRQAIQQFGADNMPDKYKPHMKAGGARLEEVITVCHLIEPNGQDWRTYGVPEKFAYRELYFDSSCNDGHCLRLAGFEEKPGSFSRWLQTGNDPYGLSPGMDAIPDIMQLQHSVLRKGQALDKLVNPPVVVEGFMARNRSSLMPGGRTTAPSGASFGAKPVYTVNPPMGEMAQDLNELRYRIQQTFHNDLFRMISSLDTVRSATEIDARKEERLVLLSSVLERFENEALDPIIRRVYGIMKRKGLLPEPPGSLRADGLQVDYVSILTDAQRAVGTATTERFLQVYGNVAALHPEVTQTINIDEIMRDYGDRLSLPASHFRSREEVAQAEQANAEMQEAQQAALVGNELTNAAQNLSNTDVGGGRNALSALLGPG